MIRLNIWKMVVDVGWGMICSLDVNFLSNQHLRSVDTGVGVGDVDRY